ncbi:MAG: Cell cycle serine/threonine-protein kinase cdc5/MSD2, partial [Pleopsidium flavum]
MLLKQNALSKKEVLGIQATADRKTQKDKDHPPKPPQYVFEPNGPNGEPGEKYKTGSLLGKGGFAICHKAELCSERYGAFTQDFALKIVKTNMGQRKMAEKFRTELQIHSKLRHPNIVEFHRAFTFQESTYVVLELCHNGSVMDMVRQRRYLSLPEVRRITIQLCGAVKYMHQRNIIHRDLKMGNLFLDSEMNIKVGDFGLAAILITDKEAKGFKRRTTLCGTPNYIAPEIFAKGRKGHDYKVDLWAIGIVIFAMLTGYPPFQSTTQDEIYRKVQDLNYVWPMDTKSQNHFPEEVKDLVRSLLKVDAEERPEPDEIVGHDFFLMHNGNGIPRMLDSSCRRGKPNWLGNRHPMGDAMDAGVSILWTDICRQCGVGRKPGSEPYPIVGQDTAKTLYKQCLEEELDGRTPKVPVPEQMVYTSYPSPERWPPLLDLQASEELLVAARTKDPASETPNASQMHALPAINPQLDSEGLNRQSNTAPSLPNQPHVTIWPRRMNYQSHAAQLRQKAQPTAKGPLPPGRPCSVPTSNLTTELAPKSLNSAPELASAKASLSDLPVRRPSKSATVPSKDPYCHNPSRVTRSATVAGDSKNNSKPRTLGKRGVPKSASTKMVMFDTVIDKSSTLPDCQRRTRSASTRGKLGATINAGLADTVKTKAESSHGELPPKTRSWTKDNGSEVLNNPRQALIGPNEMPEYLPFTSALSVRQALKEMYTNLGDALAMASSVKDCEIDIAHPESQSLKDRPPILKWVDYTNKYGIGYILSDGSVGCVFKGEDGNPPTCIVVRGGEEHLKKRSLAAYTDKHQIVPQDGPPIELFENCGDRGIKRVLVQPTEFRVDDDKSAFLKKIDPGRDTYECRKRRVVCLFSRFAKYLSNNVRKSEEDQHSPDDEVSPERGENGRNTAKGFVRFYQRLGNVGVWGFGNGSFQFNFPDHTKIVISRDGKWCDFYHLPVEGAKYLNRNHTLPMKLLEKRDVLSYPVSVLLQGHYKPKDSKDESHVFKKVIVVNHLPEKLAFIQDVARRWHDCGGIGCMGEGEQAKLKWEGMAVKNTGDKSDRLIWDTVGARG